MALIDMADFPRHIRVVDAEGEEIYCDMQRHGNFVRITVPRTWANIDAPEPPSTQIVTGVIDSLLGATNTATEALKTLRSKLNERT
tara:strand:- start:826 stop:1083 length:258 start_codon:yes stop_codon:yes gene_type:complete